MSEVVVFLDTFSGAAWWFLCAIAVGAVGLFVLDREPKRAAGEQSKSNDRLAA